MLIFKGDLSLRIMDEDSDVLTMANGSGTIIVTPEKSGVGFRVVGALPIMGDAKDEKEQLFHLILVEQFLTAILNQVKSSIKELKKQVE